MPISVIFPIALFQVGVPLDVLQDLAIKGGTVAALMFAVFIFALQSEMLVWGFQYRRVLNEMYDWRTIALKGLKIQEGALAQTRRKAQSKEDVPPIIEGS